MGKTNFQLAHFWYSYISRETIQYCILDCRKLSSVFRHLVVYKCTKYCPKQHFLYMRKKIKKNYKTTNTILAVYNGSNVWLRIKSSITNRTFSCYISILFWAIEIYLYFKSIFTCNAQTQWTASQWGWDYLMFGCCNCGSTAYNSRGLCCLKRETSYIQGKCHISSNWIKEN